MSKKCKERIGLGFLNAFFLALCFATLIPILYALSVSFSGQNSLLSSDFSFIPKDFTLENYKRVIFGEDILLWFPKDSPRATDCLSHPFLRHLHAPGGYAAV